MAGKLPKKQKHNLGRSHFKTYDDWYTASRKEHKIGNAIHYSYDASRVAKKEWTNYDKRLMNRVATNERSARGSDLELVFGSPIQKGRRDSKPSKQRGMWTSGSEPLRMVA